MYLVERHCINKNNKLYKECDELSFKAKLLYNNALYLVRQNYIEVKKLGEDKGDRKNYLNYYDINRIMIDSKNQNYTSLNRRTSNTILKLLDKNWVSYFNALRDYYKNPEKYKSIPRIPGYKGDRELNREDGRFIVPFLNKTLSKEVYEKTGKIYVNKTNIYVKSKIHRDDIIQLRIVPKTGCYIIEIVYKKKLEKLEVSKDNFIGLDLGINNLASISGNYIKPFIINGKPLKSINQFYNKKKGILQNDLKIKHDKNTSHKLQKLSLKRNNKVIDYLHKASRYLINFCIDNGVNRIIIGYNENWKQEINIGKKNNQNFVNIPFLKFIEQIEYKAKLKGIEVIRTEESYTSKCSFLDNESVEKHEEYLGKRIKRGLFKSSNGKLINSDINGSLNIIKKVVPMFNVNSLNYGIEGVVVHPIKIYSFV